MVKFSFPKSSSRCQLSGPGSLEQTKDLCRRSRKGTGCVGMLWSIFTHAPFAGTQKKHLGMLHQCLDLPRESPWLSPPFFCRGSLPKFTFSSEGCIWNHILESIWGFFMYTLLVHAWSQSWMHRDGMENRQKLFLWDFTFCRLAKENHCDVGIGISGSYGFFLESAS